MATISSCVCNASGRSAKVMISATGRPPLGYLLDLLDVDFLAGAFSGVNCAPRRAAFFSDVSTTASPILPRTVFGLSAIRRGRGSWRRRSGRPRPSRRRSHAEGDLVLALEVTAAVRVAVLDQLEADLLLDAPADRVEVADEPE